MVDRCEDRASEERSDSGDGQWRKRPAPRKRENDDAQDWDERGPGEKR
jgi:hypothetical protein